VCTPKLPLANRHSRVHHWQHSLWNSLTMVSDLEEWTLKEYEEWVWTLKEYENGYERWKTSQHSLTEELWGSQVVIILLHNEMGNKVKHWRLPNCHLGISIHSRKHSKKSDAHYRKKNSASNSKAKRNQSTQKQLRSHDSGSIESWRECIHTCRGRGEQVSEWRSSNSMKPATQSSPCPTA